MWLVVVRESFGMPIQGAITLILCLQAFSFGDLVFGMVLSGLWGSMMFAADRLLTSSILHQDTWGQTSWDINSLAKVLIVCSVAVRTLSHVLERIPPLVNGDSNKFGSQRGLEFAFSSPYRSTVALLFGDISEMGSGLPGRLFPVVVYLVMWRFGYRSKTLMDIGECNRIRSGIFKEGWTAYPETKELFSWARKRKRSNSNGFGHERVKPAA